MWLVIKENLAIKLYEDFELSFAFILVKGKKSSNFHACGDSTLQHKLRFHNFPKFLNIMTEKH